MCLQFTRIVKHLTNIYSLLSQQPPPAPHLHPASGFHSQVPVFCVSVDSWRKTLYKAVRGFAQTSLYRTYAQFLCLELPGKVISLKNVVYSICSQKICQCYETVKAVYCSTLQMFL